MSLPSILSPCANVRRSCEKLVESEEESKSVSIDNDKLLDLAVKIVDTVRSNSRTKSHFVEWDECGWHYTGKGYSGIEEESLGIMRDERVALYILALDTINFCFWPCNTQNDKSHNLEYEDLAVALKGIAQLDDEDKNRKTPSILDGPSTVVTVVAEETFGLSPLNLTLLTPASLCDLLLPFLGSVTLPNINERCRLLNELGHGLLFHHHGSALTMIQKAHRSADNLVQIILNTFPGFRDAAVDDHGRQIFFYKRAQIAVADLWAAMGQQQTDENDRTDHCAFYDTEKLTTFPDYRVPQLLRHEGVLVYQTRLADIVDSCEEVPAGSMDELHIRAATVVGVDRLASITRQLINKQDGSSKDYSEEDFTAVKMDWYLWQVGEKLDRDGKMKNHHRTRTIFY